MPGTFSPPPGVSDPNMHHRTCVTHVPFPLKSAAGENVPDIPGVTHNFTYLVRGPWRDLYCKGTMVSPPSFYLMNPHNSKGCLNLETAPRKYGTGRELSYGTVHNQSGRSPKVVALFLPQTSVAI